jgi:hypothetical protein
MWALIVFDPADSYLLNSNPAEVMVLFKAAWMSGLGCIDGGGGEKCELDVVVACCSVYILVTKAISNPNVVRYDAYCGERHSIPVRIACYGDH